MTVSEAALLALPLFAYFLPTLVAIAAFHSNPLRVLAFNALFGWTVVGWVILLIAASTDDFR